MKTLTHSLFIFFFSLCLISEKANASHALGAEFSYECLGGNMYGITYTFYRDCVGITPTDPMDINITNACGFPVQPVYLNHSGLETELHTTCASASSSCQGGPYFGVQKWTYYGVVTLAGPCNEWVFSHAESARVAALSTITGGGADILYTECKLSNISGICNSSPVLESQPRLIFCVGQLIQLQPNVFDPDGDSLVFDLITPRTGPNPGDTVTFIPGFSSTQPFTSQFAITFDPQTGELTGLPTQSDFTMVAVLISEYRNGQLVGQTTRDMIIDVENCNNYIPLLTGVNGTVDYNINVVAGQQNCFSVASVDPDVANTTSISLVTPLPNMTFTNLSGHRDTAVVCYTPSLSDTNLVFCFELMVNDGNCPFEGINRKTYCMHIDGIVEVEEILISDLTIWPNPVTSELNFNLDNNIALTENYILRITDLQGRSVSEISLEGNNQKIDLTNVDPGSYLFSMNDINNRKAYHKKFIKN